jgi:L-sorbose 1-phosphate reductase
MSDKLEAYRKVQGTLPKEHLAWEVYGAGFENLGKDGKPVSVPVPKPGPNEALARIDAVSLCFSDIKVIKLGSEHPRLAGRDLPNDPVVPGHEVALTIVEVGEQLKDRFSVGQRYVVQADAFFKGQSMAFGYALRGGAAQYTIINEVLHSGDEGSYLLPMADTTGYSEAALSEPWACVEASYHIHSRSGVKPNGHTWIIGLAGADLENFFLGEDFGERGLPKRVLLTDIQGRVETSLKQLAFQKAFRVEETLPLQQFLVHLEEKGGCEFDDIILLGKPRPGLVERLSAFLAREGHFAIVSPELVEVDADIDIGRIHYDRLRYIGTSSAVITDAYKGRRTSALSEGGAAWIIGAGGPMGQMHLQRTLDRSDGSHIVLATDVDDARLEYLKERYEPLAETRKKLLAILNAKGLSREEVLCACGCRGFRDIALMAPVAKLAEEAWPYLEEQGLMNIFAGVAKGTKAKLRLSPIVARGCRLVGSSGSGLGDMRFTLAEAEAGRLATDKAVAAIGGIAALGEGLQGVAAGKFPGKVVIYPQLDFPLIPLPEVKNHFPTVAEKMDQGFWNREAEGELLEKLLP